MNAEQLNDLLVDWVYAKHDSPEMQQTDSVDFFKTLKEIADYQLEFLTSSQ